MNLYIRYFAHEAFVKSVEEAADFLRTIPEIKVEQSLINRINAFYIGSSIYPYHLKVSFNNYVIIINADKIALTGDKMDKELYSHSGRPGGLRRDSYAELLKNKPERIIMHAVKGMLPKNKLAKVQLTRLRVFAGAEHPHTAQQPQVFEIEQVSQQAK